MMIDLFRIKPSLRYSNDDSAGSKAGQVATIFLVFGTLLIAGIQLSNVFLRNDFKTSVSDQITEDPGELILTDEIFPFGVALEDPRTFELFMNESIYTIHLTQYIKTKYIDSNNKEKFSYQTYNIDLEKCSLNHFPQDARENFEKAFLNERYCVAKNQTISRPKLKGVWESDVNHYLLLEVKKCVNNTNTTVCASDAEIDRMLRGGYIDLTYVDVAVDLTNFETPAYKFKNSYFTNTGSDFRRIINVYLKRLVISSDNGFIYEELEDHDYILWDSAQELFIPTANTEKIFEMQFQLSRNTKIQKRVYVKILDVISKINGGFAALFLVLSILLKPYLNFKYYEQLINQAFDIKFRVPLSRKQRRKIAKNKSKAAVKKINQAVLVGEDQKVIPVVNVVDESAQRPIMSRENMESQILIGSPGREKSEIITTPPTEEKNNSDFKSFNGKNSPSIVEFKKIPYHFPDKSIVISSDDIEKEGKKEEVTLEDKKEEIKLEDMKLEFMLLPKSVALLENSEKPKSKDDLKNPSISRTKILDDPNSQEKDREKEKDLDKDKDEGNVNPTMLLDDENPKNPSHKRRGIIFDPNAMEYMTADTIIDGAKINLGFLEYYLSFICKSEKTRQKIEILNEGINVINKVIDINYIMKNAKEVDQLKTLFLSPDQISLMNNLPKPIIPQPKDHELKRIFENQVEMFKYFIPDKGDILRNDNADKDLIRKKQRLSTVDHKLIAAFKK